MNVGVMYSGIGGANGADYVADFMVHGFEEIGAKVHRLGSFGGYQALNFHHLDGLGRGALRGAAQLLEGQFRLRGAGERGRAQGLRHRVLRRGDQ